MLVSPNNLVSPNHRNHLSSAVKSALERELRTSVNFQSSVLQIFPVLIPKYSYKVIFATVNFLKTITTTNRTKKINLQIIF